MPPTRLHNSRSVVRLTDTHLSIGLELGIATFCERRRTPSLRSPSRCHSSALQPLPAPAGDLVAPLSNQRFPVHRDLHNLSHRCGRFRKDSALPFPAVGLDSTNGPLTDYKTDARNMPCPSRRR